ncbi:hypothetical protein C8Q80DRAFT_1151680 [Daedaleopsis nitida]|nr:hypothetical protein C8Q80DRAFT_1151680 [Daedaleopsis nitida]
MILPDDTPASPTKSRTGPPTEQSEEDLVAPPPAYPGHSSSSALVAAPVAAPSQYPHHVDIEAQASDARTPLIPPNSSAPAHHVEQVEHAPSRFFKAFGLAVLIYIVAVSFTRTIIAGSSHPSHYQLPLPKRSDGKVHRCQSVSSLGSSHSFDFPLSSDVLYLFSRGDYAVGSINLLSINDGTIPADHVRIKITASSSSNALLSSSNVCSLERSPTERGIGILTPSNGKLSTDYINFAIQVHFPASSFRTLHVKAFETDLPYFAHTAVIEDRQVTFGSIHLRSRNMGITSAAYLDADEAIIQTFNAPITGLYRAHRSLSLVTTNDALDARVILFHDNKRQTPTNLTMRTTNSNIKSAITFRSTTAFRTGGAFAVNAHTENGAITARVDEQPPDSTLALDAHTRNAPALVELDTAYEGEIALAATHSGEIEFAYNQHPSDPAQRGRKRRWLPAASARQMVQGHVWWASDGSEEPRGMGRVSVRSENGPVHVTA